MARRLFLGIPGVPKLLAPSARACGGCARRYGCPRTWMRFKPPPPRAPNLPPRALQTTPKPPPPRASNHLPRALHTTSKPPANSLQTTSKPAPLRASNHHLRRAPNHQRPPQRCMRISGAKIIPRYTRRAEAFGAIRGVMRILCAKIWPPTNLYAPQTTPPARSKPPAATPKMHANKWREDYSWV